MTGHTQRHDARPPHDTRHRREAQRYRVEARHLRGLGDSHLAARYAWHDAHVDQATVLIRHRHAERRGGSWRDREQSGRTA
jgi:hypothetical protein